MQVGSASISMFSRMALNSSSASTWRWADTTPLVRVSSPISDTLRSSVPPQPGIQTRKIDGRHVFFCDRLAAKGEAATIVEPRSGRIVELPKSSNAKPPEHKDCQTGDSVSRDLVADNWGQH